jgi:O-antigen biosynthesis protein
MIMSLSDVPFQNWNLLVSIVTNNSENVVEDCLTSVAKATTSTKYHICVLDNHSNDRTNQLVKDKFPQVELIKSDKKRGFGSNQNDIIKKYINRASYILILNDDAFLSEGSIDKMIDFMVDHPDIGAICPSLRYQDGRIQISGTSLVSVKREIIRNLGLVKIVPEKVKNYIAKLPNWLKLLFGSEIRGYLSNFEEGSSTDSYRCVGNLTAACLLVRAQVLQEVGLFDNETFFMYYEDIDLSRRISNGGWKMAVLNDVIVTHYSKRNWSAFSQIEHEKSMFKFYQKYKSPPVEILLLALVTIITSCFKLVGAFISKLIGENQNNTDSVKAYLHIIGNSSNILKNLREYAKECG